MGGRLAPREAVIVDGREIARQAVRSADVGTRSRAAGRVTRHGRQKVCLVLKIAHNAARGLRAAFVQMEQFLREVQHAPQLTAVER